MRFLDGEKALPQNGHAEAPAQTVLVQRRPMRAVTLAGVVGALLSLVPLFIAPQPGPLRIVCFAVLALASLSLAFLGRARSERTELTKSPSGLSWGGEALPLPAYVSLEGDLTEDPPLYRAVVFWHDGRRRVALERDEPGPVLADALALTKRLELELRPGWGLERHFGATGLAEAWASSAEGDPSFSKATSPSHVDVAPWHAQRRVAGTTFVAGVFVLVSTAVFIRSPERSIGPSTLELALPVLAACFAIVLGAILFGVKRRIELSPAGIDATTLLYGVPIGARTRLASGVARAFAVAPDGGPARHVLFATTSGPASIAAHSEGADWLVARILHPAQSKPPAAPRPVATSARYRGPDRPARLRS
jgi:hypothetical protein